jgi:predicted oxidoreductase
MERIQLDDNLTFSRLVAGMMNLTDWNLTRRERLNWIQECMEMGITTFDHADIYGGYTCEAAFGEVMTPALRQKLELVTKCGIMLVSENRPYNQMKHYDTTRRHVIGSAENSLRMLQTDYIDLLLIHRPDPLMDADEVAEAFLHLRNSGKVRHFGVSNFSPSQYDLLSSRLPFPLVTNQVEFSPLHMEPLTDGTFDQCQQLLIRPMVWSPFAGGRVFRPDDEPSRRLHYTLNAIGKEMGGLFIDQVLLAWILTHPVQALPIIGTGKKERLSRAVEASAMRLERQQWFRIWAAVMGADVP